MNHHTNSSSPPMHAEHAGERPYARLTLMTVLSFFAMYFLMYAMVNAIGNVYLSVNQVYMAALMTAPMVLIELTLMQTMYPNRRRNALWGGTALVAGVLSFVAIRQQTAIGDRQFLRSMIPHHAGALLMCREAAITDPEIRTLCQSIIAGQQAEIDQMKTMLDRLARRAQPSQP